MVHIKKSVPKRDMRLLADFERQSTATVHEAMLRTGAIDPAIKPIVSGMRVCGFALTVGCHTGDNLMLIKAISMAKAGDVIVVNSGNAKNSGPFGEVLAVECKTKGVRGLVTTGSIRDKREIAQLGFPVFSSGICISGTAKATLGTINHPLSFGGQVVRPGDIILGDDDGLVVIPIENAEEVIRLSDERTAKEASVMERLRAGESLFEMYGYQNTLDALNCVEEL